jgi:hypothetical protein
MMSLTPSFDFQVYAWLKKKLPSHLVEIIMFMTHETMSMRLYADLMSITIEMNVKRAVHGFQNGNKWLIASYMREDLVHINEAAFCVFNYSQVMNQVTHTFLSKFFFNANIYEFTLPACTDMPFRPIERDIYGEIKYTEVVICGELSNVSEQDMLYRLEYLINWGGATRVNFDSVYESVLYNNKLYSIGYVQTVEEFEEFYGFMMEAI